MNYVLLIIGTIAPLLYGPLIFKDICYPVNEEYFKQAVIFVNFKNETIYKAKVIAIDLDDFSKPHHKIDFISKTHSEKFKQRLSIFLQKLEAAVLFNTTHLQVA